ncbi:Carboxylesterase 1 [Vitis vinifera]|uniref:Carboxylesterase 1 n=1 Tax=Vitis vinifera TaxID=29760 RepID=A0A438FR55_VITVI|nr:Carboxylesterase 1 [Vitis vinifera]
MPEHPAVPNFNDYLKMVNNPDGSVTRPVTLPSTAPSPDHTTDIPVLSKDITINPDKNIWVRVFLPREARDSTLLPLELQESCPLSFISTAAVS